MVKHYTMPKSKHADLCNQDLRLRAYLIVILLKSQWKDADANGDLAHPTIKRTALAD